MLRRRRIYQVDVLVNEKRIRRKRHGTTGGNRERWYPYCSQITWSRNPNFWNEGQIRGKLVIGINGGCIELMVSRTGSDLTLHLLRHRRFRLGCRLVLSLPFLPCKIHQNKTTTKIFAFLSNQRRFRLNWYIIFVFFWLDCCFDGCVIAAFLREFI